MVFTLPSASLYTSLHFQFALHCFYTSLKGCFKFAKGLEALWHRSTSQGGGLKALPGRGSAQHRLAGPAWSYIWDWVSLSPRVKDMIKKFLCIGEFYQWKLVSSEKSLIKWINLRITIGRSILCIAAYHVIPNIFQNHFQVHAAGRPLHMDSTNFIRCMVHEVWMKCTLLSHLTNITITVRPSLIKP